MDSPYLAQALAQMKAQPDAQQPQGPDLMAMQKASQAKDAWQAQNPGQSYMGHTIGQIGQNLAGIPQRLGQIPGQLAALPSQIMGQGQPPPMGQPQPGMAAPMPQQMQPQQAPAMAPQAQMPGMPPQVQGAPMGGLSGLLSLGQGLRR